MQTFLPYADFAMSARALDRQRLGKQRVESMQIMKSLALGGGWANHPATRMWRGFEWSLLQYQVEIIREWTGRGYKDTCLGKTADIYYAMSYRPPAGRPPWLGDPEFHRAHQSNLVRKDLAYYGPLFPGVPGDLEYVWPTR